MMKSKWLRKLLRMLITLLGAGVGAALALLGLQMYSFVRPDATVPLGALVLSYIGACGVFMLVFYLAGNVIIDHCMKLFYAAEKYMDRLPFSQVMSCMIGLIIGLVIAMLVSQMVNFLGSGVFVTALSAILYVLLGLLGWSIGWKRGGDIQQYFSRMGEKWDKRSGRKQAAETAGSPKLIDSSVLIDGRLADVCATGFIEGEMIVPQFIVDELRQIADSAEPTRRARGRRGLDMVRMLTESKAINARVDDTDYQDTTDADVKLMRLAQQLNAAIVTGDSNLCKAGVVTGVKMLNLHALASALKTKLSAGDELTVQVVKEGREAGQGVAYHEDGTMIVIDGARSRIGETLTVTVTSVLQTSAGRMIFARL